MDTSLCHHCTVGQLLSFSFFLNNYSLIYTVRAEQASWIKLNCTFPGHYFAHSCMKLYSSFIWITVIVYMLFLLYFFIFYCQFSLFYLCFLTCSTCFHLSFYFLLTMFIVMHQYTKANTLYVKTYLAINLILIILCMNKIRLVQWLDSKPTQCIRLTLRACILTTFWITIFNKSVQHQTMDSKPNTAESTTPRDSVNKKLPLIYTCFSILLRCYCIWLPRSA